MPERVQIEVQSIGKPKEWKDNVVTQIKDVDGNIYNIWGQEYLGWIKKNPEFYADFEVKESKGGDGNIYRNKQLVQIYDKDGNGIIKKKSKGNYSKGKTPEELRSIERQTSVKVAASIYVAGTVKVDQLIADAEIIYQWISGGKQVSTPPAEQSVREEKPLKTEAKKDTLSSEKEKRLDTAEKQKALYQKCHDEYGLTIAQVDAIVKKDNNYNINNPDHFRKIWELVKIQKG